jgi:hypothetical protein
MYEKCAWIIQNGVNIGMSEVMLNEMFEVAHAGYLILNRYLSFTENTIEIPINHMKLWTETKEANIFH